MTTPTNDSLPSSNLSDSLAEHYQSTDPVKVAMLIAGGELLERGQLRTQVLYAKQRNRVTKTEVIHDGLDKAKTLGYLNERGDLTEEGRAYLRLVSGR